MAYFTTSEHPVARKPHQCTVCYRIIDPGETYLRGRGYDGGDAWTFKQCSHCLAVTRIYDPRDNDGLVSEEAFEFWMGDGARDLAELRHMAGFRMRWRATSGRLLPEPSVLS